MLARANKHIRKYNQLVEVYDPAGLEAIETVSSRADDHLADRTDELSEIREQVTQLTADDFFDEQRKTEIVETESLSGPEDVADSQREKLLDRLSSVEDALEASRSESSGLDTADELDF